MKKKSKFSKLANELRKEGADDPKALAAWIGRKKLSKEKFQSLAAKGRRRAEREKANA
jgi:hypothetical protein